MSRSAGSGRRPSRPCRRSGSCGRSSGAVDVVAAHVAGCVDGSGARVARGVLIGGDGPVRSAAVEVSVAARAFGRHLPARIHGVSGQKQVAGEQGADVADRARRAAGVEIGVVIRPVLW